MIKAFIVGINGKMGKMLVASAQQCGFEITGGYDLTESGTPPTFTDAKKVNIDYDVIIDFSRPDPNTLDAIKFLAEKRACPAVIATTGFDAAGIDKINALAKKVPVFRTANFSLGIAATKAAAIAVKKILGSSFDIEIVEKHHNQKADSPSGTALLLADALAPKDKQVINRDGKRGAGELGITSVRGGGVVGEHEVGFYGDDEIVTITHSARSRRLFALGAFEAARFVIGKAPKLYDMDDLVKELID